MVASHGGWTEGGRIHRRYAHLTQAQLALETRPDGVGCPAQVTGAGRLRFTPPTVRKAVAR